MTASVASAPKKVGKHLAAPIHEPEDTFVRHETAAPQRVKGRSTIDIVLVCAILFLSVSMGIYLLSLLSHGQEKAEVPVSSGKEVFSSDTVSSDAGSPVETVLSAEEEREPVPAEPLSYLAPKTPEELFQEAQNYASGTGMDLYEEAQRAVPGSGIALDLEKAFPLYKMAADSGHAAAQYYVYVFEMIGLGGAPFDPNTAMNYLRCSAENGYAAAQFELGFNYAMFDPSPECYANAAVWYEKAAAQGYGMAQNNLGNLYYRGNGVPTDYRKAYQLFQAAAKQGIPEAKFNLGTMYEDGRGLPKDCRKSFDLYYEAAMAGYPPAQSYVADYYFYGVISAPNMQKAFYWYSQAAEKGDTAAQYQLGYMYKNGIGVAQNDQYAALWYRRAADSEQAEEQSAVNTMSRA